MLLLYQKGMTGWGKMHSADLRDQYKSYFFTSQGEIRVAVPKITDQAIIKCVPNSLAVVYNFANYLSEPLQ